MKENAPDSWKEEFASKFNIAYVHDKGWAFLGAEVQDFISNLLTTQRSRDRAELVEKVTEMRDMFREMRSRASDSKDYEAAIRFTAKYLVLEEVLALLTTD